MTSNAPHCKACSTLLNPAQSLGQKNGFDLLPCPNCGTVTVAPFPTVEELTAFYQAYTGTCDYTKKAPRKISRAARRIRRMVGRAPGKRFLDVGCNYGFTVEAARQLGLDAHGIDIDAEAVKASVATYGPRYTAISVQDYAAAGNKADMIYTSEVIEHVPDAQSFAAAIGAILNPGGMLTLTTPDGGHWNKPSRFVDWIAVMPPEHIIYFTKKGLKQLFEKHGFTHVRFRPTLKPGIRMTARKAA